MSKIYDYVINNEVNKNVLKSIVAAEGGGGGETWETIFEGEVTTVFQPHDGVSQGTIQAAISGSPIKVTFNGDVFTVNKQTVESSYYYGELDANNFPAFNTYPFFIDCSSSNPALFTPEAGTYSLKIEEPGQSGGSSDFSTAEITVRLDEAAGSPGFVVACVEIPNNNYKTGFCVNEETGITTETLTNNFQNISRTVNYYIKQNSFISLNLRGCTLNNIEGLAEAATFEGNQFIKIYGDCVINANVIK